MDQETNSRHPLLNMLHGDIEEFIRRQRELLFNERDLQTTLAWQFRNSGHYDSVDLEYGVPLEELAVRGLKVSTKAQLADEFPWTNNLSIDIVVEKDGTFAATELKYTTRPVNAEITRFGEPLRTDALIVHNQAASNLVMYNLWKDVRRIEVLRKCYPNVCGGVALMISNEVSRSTSTISTASTRLWPSRYWSC